jgi:hypothetical protein
MKHDAGFQSTSHIPSFILEVKSITQKADGSYRLPKEKLILKVVLNRNGRI